MTEELKKWEEVHNEFHDLEELYKAYVLDCIYNEWNNIKDTQSYWEFVKVEHEKFIHLMEVDIIE